jgi:hypothetical protein
LALPFENVLTDPPIKENQFLIYCEGGLHLRGRILLSNREEIRRSLPESVHDYPPSKLLPSFYPVKRVEKGRTVKLGVSRYSEMVAVDAIVVCFQSTPNFPSWAADLTPLDTLLRASALQTR